MLGLMYLTAAALYFGVMFLVVRWAWRKGRADGGSRWKASAFALVGFLAVYLPVFWNHIPIVLTHRAMCAKDAGFKAYVEPEDWRKANQSAIAAMSAADAAAWSSKTLTPNHGFDTYFGGLLLGETISTVEKKWGVKFSRTESRTLDAKTGTLLATSINYQAGSRDDARRWFAGDTCYAQDDPQPTWRLHSKFERQLKGESK